MQILNVHFIYGICRAPTSIGDFVVKVSHDSQANPDLLVRLGVVRANSRPPGSKQTSSHLVIRTEEHMNRNIMNIYRFIGCRYADL